MEIHSQNTTFYRDKTKYSNGLMVNGYRMKMTDKDKSYFRLALSLAILAEECSIESNETIEFTNTEEIKKLEKNITEFKRLRLKINKS